MRVNMAGAGTVSVRPGAAFEATFNVVNEGAQSSYSDSFRVTATAADGLPSLTLSPQAVLAGTAQASYRAPTPSGTGTALDFATTGQPWQAGQTGSVRVSGTVPAHAPPGMHEVCGEQRSAVTLDPEPGNNRACVTVEVLAFESDLAVTTGGAYHLERAVDAGETFTLRYDVTNNGPDAARPAALVLRAPEGISIGRVDAASGWSCTGGSRERTCTRPDSPRGAGASFTVDASAAADLGRPHLQRVAPTQR